MPSPEGALSEISSQGDQNFREIWLKHHYPLGGTYHHRIYRQETSPRRGRRKHESELGNF